MDFTQLGNYLYRNMALLPQYSNFWCCGVIAGVFTAVRTRCRVFNITSREKKFELSFGTADSILTPHTLNTL